MSHYNALFTPGRIGGMEIKNRLIMAPMVRNYADTEGRVTTKYLAHIERIARGGVGAMILEAAYVMANGKGFINQLGIHEDTLIPGLGQLVAAAHAEGVMIGPQLFHAGRQTSSHVTGVPPIAPSSIPDPTVNEMPNELTPEGIKQVVWAFARGARRAREADCDFVELHGAHGYLITEFLSPFSNQRTDDYGGSFENRMRFLVEIIEAVRQEVGADFPIIVRLSGDEMTPGGLTINDTIAIARWLEVLRVNALHISACNYASYNKGMLIPPMAVPDGPLVLLAQKVKEAVSIPVIAVGKIRTPDFADEIIREGRADFIGLGRVLLADPDWPNKALEGREEAINKCIACNQGCITRLFEQLDAWCTVNPETSREVEFAALPPARKMRLLVAGGGPAGMEAAKVAAECGHQVTLFEETGELGGQLLDAAQPPHRPGWEELRGYLMEELRRLKVGVHVNTKVTVDLVQQQNPDVVINACGSLPVRLNIPGMLNANVIFARDLLEGRAEADGRVIVAGGGCSGAQTAEYLASRGHQVTIVEMKETIADDAPAGDRDLLLQRLADLKVAIMTNTTLSSISAEGATVETANGTETLPAETIVFCLGSAPNSELSEQLEKMGIRFVSVGDAFKPRRVTEAILEGALSILHLQAGESKKAA